MYRYCDRQGELTLGTVIFQSVFLLFIGSSLQTESIHGLCCCGLLAGEVERLLVSSVFRGPAEQLRNG